MIFRLLGPILQVLSGAAYPYPGRGFRVLLFYVGTWYACVVFEPANVGYRVFGAVLEDPVGVVFVWLGERVLVS